MTVAELFHAVPGAHVPPEIAGREVGRLRLDSRTVGKGDLFFALPGQKLQGARFAADAIAAGALGVVSQEPISGAPTVRVPAARQSLALCAAALADHPDRKLRLVGITGTNGKTTTALLVAAVVEARGELPGVIGTVGYRVGARTEAAPFTTPEAPELCDLLAEMVRAGVPCCAMEVSSHALAQERVAGLTFAAAGFTHLTRDHLDFHGDMESYFLAKRRLFVERLARDGAAVVNGDDPHGARLARDLAGWAGPVWRFGRAPGAEIRIEAVDSTLSGTRVALETPAGRVDVDSKLVGAHHAENLALAAGLSLALGYPEEVVARGLSSLASVPGRLERVPGPLPAFVDYAHTDDALGRVCASLRAVGAERLVLVFGCGGDRDPGKRPLMGEAAARGADLVVTTSDNPRSERPESILEAIIPGLARGGARPLTLQEAGRGEPGYLVEPDRARAIALAVRCAGPRAVVLVAGKGHEDYQIVGAERRHFDDREVLAQALAGAGP
ncbi:MAG TPA: UDP-N-acetylmuramoyl-L-alanyl-D-glutamate--2,6-diaminopimelate ligase [Myxococcales bacterium]|nr:UDP-N-acetylmuramoyl-L-alanyl-D-glutamate--2,6-diaminopimelate ligase [Myxococcales bacterium]